MSEFAYDARVSTSVVAAPLKTDDTRYPTENSMDVKVTTEGEFQKQQEEQQHQFNMADKAVLQLLNKLDEGTQTIANLRSILTLKTAELNELVAQLELTNQAIMNVESTTAQIESMLKDLGLSGERETLLLNAEASLDSAIKSASSLYDIKPYAAAARRQSTVSNGSAGQGATTGMDPEQRRENRVSSARFVSRIRYKPDTKHILRQLNELLRDLELDSAKFFESIGTTDDVQALQKAKVDLDIAKTIALSAKSNLKRRSILLRSARRRNAPEEVKMLGTKIRESVALWKTYARGAPMLVDGQDILAILDREDDLIARNLPVHPSRISYDGYSNKGSPTPSSSGNTRTMRNSCSSRSTESTGSHSRTASLHAGLPVEPPPSSPVKPTTPPLAATTTTTTTTAQSPPPSMQYNTKKLHRHSAAIGRTPVKASVGVARVRTSSLTAHKATRENASNKPAVNPPATTAQKATKELPPSAIPLPSAAADGNKKSALKPPTQRGPGSTLRIRSMLAKRNQQHTSS